MAALKLRALVVAALAFAGLLTGCATAPERHPPVHVVERGDTLYSIAWRNGVDYRTLARLNHIEPPYLIHPGQKLRLGASSATFAAASGRPAVTPLATQRGAARPQPLAPYLGAAQPEPLARPEPGPQQPVAATASPRPAAQPAPRSEPSVVQAMPAAQPAPRREPPVAQAMPAVRPTPQAAPPAPARPAQPASSTAGSGANMGWLWPSSGPIIKTFTASEDGKRGINIAGELGQPVLAARNGRVVYSGSGLRGYGNLVIVKHDASYLTAYGYNQQLLVKEGETVRAGQRIATMGTGDGSRPALHFEVRRDGRAVDPVTFLPPR
jgi:lipoprotein NlpD